MALSCRINGNHTHKTKVFEMKQLRNKITEINERRIIIEKKKRNKHTQDTESVLKNYGIEQKYREGEKCIESARAAHTHLHTHNHFNKKKL